MLSKHNTGLIVIDIQGKLAQIVSDSSGLLRNTTALIQGAQQLELPIIWLEQLPDKLGETSPELAQLLHPLQPIHKHTFSGYGEPAFIDALDEASVDHWLLCGIESHICVYQTALDLIKHRFHVELVSDCISSRHPDNKTLALNKLQRLGAKLTSVEMCLYEMIVDAHSDDFKPILRYIK
ncbi:hydrolase [Psychrobium sp. 1_MG-2023]|uniref:hydrolase n=1 Tax=Psychrobium sp. 1_MG-2023 TaxID=3062624 RepID=UPI000C3380D4|nr:hydrolase [Psychrobium sp. 1_MG-2023]MDP2561762.1 hydrolase [Psychrobium sp. 1_MG-2023]PKF59753.1 hydrolase [Alteromonadales bacterium alter-6D02]